MKKLALVLVLLLAVSGATLFAQANFSALPSGSWADKNENWDATWTFSSSGITVRDNQGGGSYTYNLGNIEGLKAVQSGMSAGIQFSSTDNGRTITFYPNVTNGTMAMTIERSGLSAYRVTMNKQ